MPKRSHFLLIAALAILTLFAVVACSDDTDSPFSTTTPVAEGAGSGDAVSSGPDIKNGEKKFAGLGCKSCHSTGSNSVVGPGLAGISAKGDDYIRESIVDPAAVLAEGFANLMPTSFASMKAKDLTDLIAYLKTLD